MVRTLGTLLTIFGFYLLFSPIIALLNWIPLVGALLSGIAAFAAFLFALVVGLTISVFVIALAWLFFRPLIGIPLLAAVGTAWYYTFYYDWSQTGAETSSA